MKIKTAHLFAGAGGGILADEILGHVPIVAIEIDPYACSVLRSRFPSIRVIESDIRSVDFSSGLAGVNAICAGFPCQDISAANPNGKGLSGDRSGLFWEVIRAIDAIQPDWVFLENSPRIRKKGRPTIIAELVARGYTWRDGILGAADVGAPHKRDRWWLLAKRSHTDSSRELQSQRAQQDERRWTSNLGKVCNSNSTGLEERQGKCCDYGQEQQTAIRASWWDAEPRVGRVVNGMANRSHRIRCLGNGQVPLVAALAWKLLSRH